MYASMETPTTFRNRVRFLDSREADVIEPGRDHAIDEVDRSSIPVTTCFELQEDPSFWKDNSVQVVIRIRPLNSGEISVQGHKRCVRQDTCQSITWMGHPESRFTFDHVADEHVSQEKLFKVAGVPMVENCVEGYNSCMFAYGQTGSGKTHTMLGDIEGGTRRNSVNAGITPRVFEYLFLRIQREKESRREEKLRFTCKCSFLEIYNEQILDLLDPSSSNLQIREDLRKGVYVENLAEVEVTNARDVIQLLVQGSTNRKVASTNMNSASSRSHSVFTCNIESKWELQGVTHHRFARLNLVDLAGSERQKSSGAEGERLKEATNINKSLSTLGLVIMNLVSNANKKSLHIPYRDSKLTFLLQDSLGGNSKTIIIANISPSNCNSLETLSTLKFAQRAKFIRNNAIVNEDASGDVLAMRMQIQQLKKEVNRLQGLVGGGITELSGNVSVGFPSSPGSFLLDSGHGSFSSLSFDKRFSQGMESEAALAASLKREQDKDNRIKALAAGKQAAEQLANQKIEEIKGLKMRLRFREERIKNLESRSSEKNLHVHHQQEKENLLKEIEILRNQIDRNPEITRFAMENLHLKEELRRMQSLVVESQQERTNEMTEEITILRDKLLEALDWKMMHEKDVNAVQDLSTSWEENEFLRLQAIQYERNWAVCLESKQKLQRRVEELESQVEEIKAAKAANKDSDTEVTRATVPTNDVSPDDQIELKTMVEAISAASQREAEAHETAIILAKENEELHEKIRILVEEKNKVVEFYENARVDESYKSGYDEPCVNGQKINQSQDSELPENELHDIPDIPEHNKKLSLYEQAIGERDELKRLLCSNLQQTTLKASENFQSFGLLSEAFVELQELTSKIKFVDHEIQVKQQGISSIKLCSSEIQQRKSVLGNKLSALKYVFRTFSSNPTLQYWVGREMQAKARVNAYSVQEMKEELVKLHSCRNECDVAYSKFVRSEAQLKEQINSINRELKNAENRKKESQKVLFTIDNLEKTDVSLHRSLHSGKVSELLKSEEEQAKLAAEKKKLRDSMALLQKEIMSKKKLAEKLDIRIQNMESELSESASLGEEELHLLRIIDETATISQISDARREVEILLVDYQEIIFKLLLNETEGQLFVEELEQQQQELDQLKCAHGLASGRLKQLMESGGNSATLILSMD